MSNFFTTLGVLVIAIPFITAMLVLGLLWRAWWLFPAWGWFVVPLGVSPITFWHFTALIFFGSVMTTHIDMKKDERKIEWGAAPVIILWPILTWVLLRWMHV